MTVQRDISAVPGSANVVSAPLSLRSLLIVIAIAAAYLLAAWIGRLIAPDSINPSPLSPAAGIAFAALIVFGLRFWPGLFIGALLFGVVIGGMSERSLLLTALGAGGIAAQAALGAVLTRSLFAQNLPLTSPGHVLRFLLLAGPVGCVVSASVTVAATAVFGGGFTQLAAADLWLRIWAGDALGVVLVAPLVLFAWRRMAPVWEGARWYVLLPLSLTIGILAAGNTVMQRLTDSYQQTQRQEIAELASHRVQTILNQAGESLRFVGRFFASSTAVTPDEFATYVAPLVAPQEVESISWAPRVPHKALANFETQARRSTGDADYRVFEPDDAGRPTPPAPRADYFPVLYGAPATRAQDIRGFDHNAQKERRQTMEAALKAADGLAFTTIPTRLTGEMKLVFYVANYPAGFDPHLADLEARRAALRGFVVGVIRPTPLFAGALAVMTTRGFASRIVLLLPDGTHQALIDSVPSGQVPNWNVDVDDPSFPLRYELAALSAPTARFPLYPPAMLLLGLLVSAFALAAAGDTSEHQRFKNSLVESEKRYRLLFENINAGFVLFEVVLDDHGTPVDLVILAANKEFASTTGLKLQDAIGKRLTHLLPGIEHDDADWIGTYGKIALTGEARQLEQGSELLGTYFAVSAYQPEPNRCAVTFSNITARKLADIRRSRLNLVLESIAGERELGAILDELVLAIEASAPDVKATVLLHDASGNCLHHGSAPSFSDEFNATMDGIPVGQKAGACGFAVYTKQLVIVEDIQADPLMQDYRELADKNGLRAVWSQPIFDHKGIVLGAFAMYYAEARRPTDDELDLIRTAAHIAGIAIARKQADEELRQLNAELEWRVTSRTAELQQSNAALAAQKLEIRSILDHVVDCIITIDAAGIIRSSNPATEKLFGYEKDELLGRNVSLLTPEPHASAHDEYIARYLRTGERRIIGIGRTVEGRHRDGHAIKLELAVSEFSLNGERFFTGIMRDVSERTRIMAELEAAKQAAEAANHAKSAFLATMSHEIRTPMNGVLGMLEVLQHSSLTEHQRDQVNIMHDSGVTLLALVDDILDFSKIEAGRIEFERAPVSLADLVEGVCTSQLSISRRRGVALRVFIDPELPARVLGDDMRLRQVLYNLIGNAIKFSAGNPERPGHVSVRATLASREPLIIVFTVEDNGVGMDHAAQARIFAPFTQAEASTTRRFGGTGLGLTISKRLVDLMGGNIAIVSRPDEGSIFTVTLPFALAPEQPAPVPHDLSGLTCFLLKEANLDVKALTCYLEHAGATVRACTDAEEAVRFALAKDTSAPMVLIHGDAESRFWINGELPPRLRRVRIGHGRRLRLRLDAPDCVSIDGDALRRQTLLHTVAVAAGRASPEIFDERSNDILPGELVPPPTVAQARDANRLILVAEDDSVNQKIILQQLALLGHTAEVAGNGAEALERWRAGCYALLLTDLHMPQMDGYQLAAEIRRLESRQHLPIIALTANALRGEAARAKAAGIDDYLTKPVALARLRKVLDTWLPPTEGSLVSAIPKRKLQVDTTLLALDVRVLKGLVGETQEIIDDFLADYGQTLSLAAIELRSAAAAKEFAPIAAIAHNLKSSSRSVGALPLGDLCAELENAGKHCDEPAVESCMTRFETLLAEVEGQLASLLSQEKGA